MLRMRNRESNLTAEIKLFGTGLDKHTSATLPSVLLHVRRVTFRLFIAAISPRACVHACHIKYIWLVRGIPNISADTSLAGDRSWKPRRWVSD